MQPLREYGVMYTVYFFKEVKMQSRLVTKFSLLLLVNLCFSCTMFAQEKKTSPKPLTPEELQKMDKGKRQPPKGPTFQITPIEQVKGMYLALIADDQGRTLEEFFLFEKLPVLEAIVSEAKKFGLTEESVGGAKPLTTRFSDKQLPNFLVDVSKVAKRTHFYVTMLNQKGKITVDAGEIKRGDPEATAMLYDILTKIQAAKSQGEIQ
jgi:hypothetical protein